MKETLKINRELDLKIEKLEREKQRDNVKIHNLERNRQIDNKNSARINEIVVSTLLSPVKYLGIVLLSLTIFIKLF